MLRSIAVRKVKGDAVLTVRRLLLVAAFVLPSWAEAQTSPVRPDQTAFRALYKELVETNIAKAMESFATRIKALEDRPSLEHRGIWRADAAYLEGNLVTLNGGLSS